MATALFRATLAEKQERWADMVIAADELAESGSPLGIQERGVIAEAYRRALDGPRAAYRVVQQIQELKRSQNFEAAAKFLDDELKYYKAQVLEYIERGLRTISKLQPKAAGREDAEAWIAKEIADFYRYHAEIDPSMRDEATQKMKRAFDAAGRLPSGDVLRSAIHLNCAIFTHDVLRNTEEAQREIYTALQELPASSHASDSLVIRALMVKNQEMWRAERQ